VEMPMSRCSRRAVAKSGLGSLELNSAYTLNIDRPNDAARRAAAEKLPVGRALLPVLCVFDGQECPSYW